MEQGGKGPIPSTSKETTSKKRQRETSAGLTPEAKKRASELETPAPPPKQGRISFAEATAGATTLYIRKADFEPITEAEDENLRKHFMDQVMLDLRSGRKAAEIDNWTSETGQQ